MPTFFLTFLATALAIAVGRDAVRVARLSAAHGSSGAMLVAIGLAALAYASLAAWLAGGLAEMLHGAAGRLFVAIALAIAGCEVLILSPPKRPAEPTRSLGATLIVLFTVLLTGAAGFLVMALAVMSRDGVLAAAGGVAGAITALGGAALAGDDWEKLPLKPMRFVGGALLVLAALVTGYLAVTSR